MKNIDRNSYNSLTFIIKSLNNNDWSIIYNHLNQAIKHYIKGFTDTNYFRDCISRTNKVFEGVVKKIYSIAKLKPNVDTNINLIGLIINELEKKSILPSIFSTKLRFYKDSIRNIETHDIYRQFVKEDAKKSLRDAYIFIFSGLKIENIISASNKLSEDDILLIYLNSFIASFDEYTNSIKLYYENIFNYIYPVTKKRLKAELMEFYNNSIFKDEFSIKNHPKINKLHPDFLIEYGSTRITFTIIKIDEYSIMHTTFSQRLEERLLIYKQNFNKNYFLLWIFTRRKKWINIICEYFKNTPNYVMFQIKDKKTKSDEVKKNHSIDDFY